VIKHGSSWKRRCAMSEPATPQAVAAGPLELQSLQSEHWRAHAAPAAAAVATQPPATAPQGGGLAHYAAAVQAQRAGSVLGSEAAIEEASPSECEVTVLKSSLGPEPFPGITELPPRQAPEPGQVLLRYDVEAVSRIGWCRRRSGACCAHRHSLGCRM
jgi:hypothetical protein